MKKPLPHDHQRGDIQDNMLKAVVTSPLFRTRVVKAKKGKGSYNRQSSRRRDHSRRPLTPPYVRFRIRRFMLTLELSVTFQ